METSPRSEDDVDFFDFYATAIDESDSSNATIALRARESSTPLPRASAVPTLDKMGIDFDNTDFYGDGESFSTTDSSIALIGGQGQDLTGFQTDNIGKFSSLCSARSLFAVLGPLPCS